MTRMLVTLLGEAGGWHLERLAAALRRHGHAVETVSWRSIGAAIAADGLRFTPAALTAADVVVVRGMPGSGAGLQRLEEVIFRMDALAQLEAAGTPVLNAPRALEIAIDKYLSLAMLARAGIRVPRTMVVQGEEAARLAWDELGRSCVVKPLFGSRGRGISRVTTADEAAATAAAVGGEGVAYLQEFIPHPGWDLRILIVGHNAFAMRRVAAAGEWRTNVSLGGRPEAVEASAEERDVARRAAAVVGARIAGVDLLPGPAGPVVLEVNAVPAWRGLQSVIDADLTDAVAREVERAAFSAQSSQTVGECDSPPLPKE
jgi:ribosomal protein S6--L-glutamate ligase